MQRAGIGKLFTTTGVLTVLLMVQILPSQSPTQADGREFRTKSEPLYHYLTRSLELKNFSCLLSSSSYINFIKEMADSSYFYPLKFLWNRDGSAYYILQPLPEKLDSSTHQMLIDKVNALKKLFKGILLDWQGFCAFSPFADIPNEARFQAFRDSVVYQYEVVDGGQVANVRKIFLPNGRLIKVLWQSGDIQIHNYPIFGEVNNAWLCQGWDSQIYQGGQITSGMAVRLEQVNIQNNWVPVRIDILAQTRQRPEEQTLTSIYLKDYLFNLQFQKLTPPKEDNPSQQNAPPK